ncbi:MAG TPA: rRNA small subunit methyltransferase B, partial [Mycobacteriales bacterium]|nr:rRNA small subunit methyltransferase B [Mycobacteriales bacterium]
GLGALRRRPESRWRRTAADVERLAGLQRELLDAGLRLLAPGGVLVYATCSPHLGETVEVVRAVNGMGTGIGTAQLIDARPLLPGVPGLGTGPTVQLWPHRHGTDAMFIAAFRALPQGHS